MPLIATVLWFSFFAQVTGRILGPFWEKPETLDVPDIEAFPELDSPARCPKFKYKYTVKVPRSGVTAEAMLLLRVYTIDVDTGELVVIGNTVVQLFRQEGEEEVTWKTYSFG